MPVTNYIWDVATDSYLMETDQNDATTAVYTNEPGDFGAVISQRRNGESHFFHRDALGSVVDVSDASESATDSYLYKAYGEVLAATGSTVNPFRWVGSLGYYYDLDLLQYYIRARHYDPVFSRWLSIDPVAFGIRTTSTAELGAFISQDPIGYESASTGLHCYVGNNPSGATDPTGLWKFKPRMGRLEVLLGPKKPGFIARFILGFLPNGDKFTCRGKGSCCSRVDFVQMCRIELNTTTLGNGWEWGVMPWNPPVNKWFVDSDPEDLPYYRSIGRHTDPRRHLLIGTSDDPGPRLGIWRLHDVSMEFETCAVCSQSAATDGSNRGLGDVFGCVEWGFSYFIRGPFWNRRPVARKMYVNKLVWNDAAEKEVVSISGGVRKRIKIGGVKWNTSYKSEVPPLAPSQRMKKTLSQYLP